MDRNGDFQALFHGFQVEAEIITSIFQPFFSVTLKPFINLKHLKNQSKFPQIFPCPCGWLMANPSKVLSEETGFPWKVGGEPGSFINKNLALDVFFLFVSIPPKNPGYQDPIY